MPSEGIEPGSSDPQSTPLRHSDGLEHIDVVVYWQRWLMVTYTKLKCVDISMKKGLKEL